MKILIVRLSALGDLLHALPLAYNAHASGATVGWLTEADYAPLLENNPSIYRLFIARTRGWRRNPIAATHWREVAALRRDLAGFAPDVTIDPQGLWKSAVLARLAAAPVVGFRRRDRRESSSAPLVDRPVPVPASVRHVVDQNLLLLEALSIPIRRRAPDARYLLETPSPAADAFLAGLQRPFAVYHPGAARPEKTWGEARYAELAALLEERTGLHTVVSWGPGDEKRVERLVSLSPRATPTPPLDLRGLARILARASLMIAGDTGPLHLADALGAPALGLFGPSARARNVPERNRPYGGSAMSYDESTAVEAVAARAVEVFRSASGARS